MRFLVTMLFLIPLCAQQPPEGGPPKRAHEPPKNLKILNADNFMPAMRSFTVALGVKCDYCHIEGNFASDDNHKKEIARHMLSLVHDINAKFPDPAKMNVTCYTCHRGAEEPLTAPAKP